MVDLQLPSEYVKVPAGRKIIAPLVTFFMHSCRLMPHSAYCSLAAAT